MNVKQVLTESHFHFHKHLCLSCFPKLCQTMSYHTYFYILNDTLEIRLQMNNNKTFGKTTLRLPHIILYNFPPTKSKEKCFLSSCNLERIISIFSAQLFLIQACSLFLGYITFTEIENMYSIEEENFLKFRNMIQLQL